MHDGVKKNGYAFEKIKEVIIMKIKKTFDPSRPIVNSLQEKKKNEPKMTERKLNEKVDTAEKIFDQVSLYRLFKEVLTHWFWNKGKFDDNWAKVYGMIFDHYCIHKM